VGLYGVTPLSFQLLPFIPFYEYERRDYEQYHWIPDKLAAYFHSSYDEIQRALGDLLFKQGLINSKDIYDFNLQSGNPLPLKNPSPEKNTSIRMVELDESAQEAYLPYLSEKSKVLEGCH